MKRSYPCDGGNCPYGDGGGMYFCRDNCGLGVDENSKPEEEMKEEIEAEKRAEQESLGNNW